MMKKLGWMAVWLVAGWGYAGDEPLRLNQERFGHAAVVVGDSIYLFGGTANEGPADKLEKIGPDRSSVEVIGTMPSPRYWVGAATDGEQVYTVGGTLFDDGICDRVERWDPQSGVWTALAELPSSRAHVGVAWLDGRLYAIGGAAPDRSRSARVDIFDPQAGTWTRGADMPTARECDVALYDGKIYVAGGYDGRASVTAFEVYDPATDSWETLPDLPFLLSAHHVAVVNDTLYAFGNYNDPARVAAYDFASGEWSLLDLDYRPARHTDVAFDGEAVYVTGGNMRGSGPYFDYVQVFTSEQLAAAPRRPAGEAEALEVEKAKPFELSPETDAALVAWAEKLAEIDTLLGDWIQVYQSDDGDESPGEVMAIAMDRPGRRWFVDGRFMTVWSKEGRIRMAANGPKRYLEQDLEAFKKETGNRGVPLLSGSSPDLDSLAADDVLASLREQALENQWRLAAPGEDADKGFWVFEGAKDDGAGNGGGRTVRLVVDQQDGLIDRYEQRHRIVVTREAGEIMTNSWVQILESVGADINGTLDADLFNFDPGSDWVKVDALTDLFPQPDRSRFELSGKAAPDFTLTLLDGSTFTLSAQTGKVVVIDFWATWCGPCVMALPQVQQLHETYGPSNVVVVGVSSDKLSQEKRVRSMVTEKGLTYAIGIDTNDTGDAYYVSGIPTLVVVGPDGTVQWRKIGYASNLAKMVGEIVEKLWAGEALPSAVPVTAGETSEPEIMHQPEIRLDPRYVEPIWEVESDDTPSRTGPRSHLQPFQAVRQPPALMVRVTKDAVSGLDPATGKPEVSLSLVEETPPEGHSYQDRWTLLRDPDHGWLFVRLRLEMAQQDRRSRTITTTLSAMNPEGKVLWEAKQLNGDRVINVVALGPARDGVLVSGSFSINLYDHKGDLVFRQNLQPGQMIEFYDHDGDGIPEVHLTGRRTGAYRLKRLHEAR